MSDWYETATKKQIQQLQCNCVPWGLMVGEPRRLMSLIPRNDRVLWRPRTGEWFLEGGGKLYDSCVYRLRSDWQRPVEKPWVDVEPYRDEQNCVCVDIPGHGAGYRIDTIGRFPEWLWTKWEWTHPVHGRRHVWYEYPGGLVRGDSPDNYQAMREQSTVPPRPVLVRFLNEVPHE